MTYLVTGATGPIGRSLVAQLLAAGARVRVTTRDREKAAFGAAVEVVDGNFATGELPAEALAGVTKAFVFPGQGGGGGRRPAGGVVVAGRGRAARARPRLGEQPAP